MDTAYYITVSLFATIILVVIVMAIWQALAKREEKKWQEELAQAQRLVVINLSLPENQKLDLDPAAYTETRQTISDAVEVMGEQVGKKLF